MTAPNGLASVPSPSLLFDVDKIESNLDLMLDMVGGDPDQLRPHIKTHKCRDILTLQLARGIQSVKCATIAESELAAQSGVPDILVAYPLVGINAERLHQLREHYPDCTFSAVVDSPEGLTALSNGPSNLPVFLDFDCGMHRTGIASGERAIELIHGIENADSLTFAGIHAYDGHIHDTDLSDRRSAFELAMKELDRFLTKLEREKIEVATIVSGGSPTFASHADRSREASIRWQCSPGTPVLWDAGYGSKHPDLEFQPAAFLLARVVSRPTSSLACVDLGHKAVSAENSLEQRVIFPEFPEIKIHSQSEEHLVVEVPDKTSLPVGKELIGIPWHVCPTVALYDEAYLLRDNRVTGDIWPIEARKRKLSI